MASTLVTYSAFLKRKFVQSEFVRDQIAKDRPFFEKINKREDFAGKSENIPILHVRPQGLAGSARSVAQNNATNVQGKELVVTTGDYHASVYIGLKALRASRSNAGAFLDNKTAEIAELYEEAMDALAVYARGNGGNALGQRLSLQTNTVTLTNPSDAMHFEEGMTVVTSDNDGSAVGHSLRAGSTTVTAVDYAAGTVTLDDQSDLDSFTNGDYLFRQGDFFGDTGTVILQGWGKQIPGTGSPADLYSVTRTSNPIRLGGGYIAAADLVDLNIEERIQLLGNYQAGRFKSKASPMGCLHPEDWHSLSISLQQRGTRPANDPDSKWGHQYLSVVTGGREQKIYADRFCPKGQYEALDPSVIYLASMGSLLGPVDEDGLVIVRAATADTFEYRLISYHALYTPAFVRHARVSLPS